MLLFSSINDVQPGAARDSVIVILCYNGGIDCVYKRKLKEGKRENWQKD